MYIPLAPFCVYWEKVTFHKFELLAMHMKIHFEAILGTFQAMHKSAYPSLVPRLPPVGVVKKNTEGHRA